VLRCRRNGVTYVLGLVCVLGHGLLLGEVAWERNRAL
jgi:hypothetical protein